MATATTSENVEIRWVPWLWIVGFHVGALLAFVPAFFSWQAVFVGLILHWLTTSVGISMTYHRLLTHRTYAVRPKPVEYLLTIIGSCAAQGGAIGMVSDHRRHHAFTEQDHDTHSPMKGLYWAHWKWWIYKNDEFTHTTGYLEHWAPDLMKDRVHRVLNDIHFIFPVAMLFLLYVLGGMPWLVWAGFVRHVACIHSSWSVNSIGHTFGYRNFETRDTSKNNWLIALITYGEGWHNNHHAAPTAAKIGMKWWEIDTTFMVIKAMSLVGLVHNIKSPKVKAEQFVPAMSVNS